MPDAHRVTTFKALLSLFASTDQIAARMGVSFTAVSDWYRRGRVPEEFWGRLITAARDAGVTGVSRSLLARLPSAKGADSVTDLFDLFPSVAALARDLGLNHATVRSWALRNNIPVEHWSGVLASARSHGIKHLTEARLRAISVAQASRRRSATLPRSEAKAGPTIRASGNRAHCTIDHNSQRFA